jgi:hypothetical protein
MFGRSERKTITVTFVQPLKGEAYFYTPIAYSASLENSKGREGRQVFADSDLALAGKLKLIFEREKMIWFEIREEKSITSSKGERLFALYYFPQRLVAGRASPFDEKATLEDIEKLFDFFVTKDQTRNAEVQQTRSLSAYGSLVTDSYEESEAASVIVKEWNEESEAMPISACPEKHTRI